MPRIDDYKQALEMGRKALSGKNPDLVASFSGAEIHRDQDGKISFCLVFLNRALRISWPEMDFSYKIIDETLSIQQQILLLHYVVGAWSASGPAITGKWCSFQDIPDGRFYLDAFLKRAKVPLLQTFGDNPERLVEVAAKAYGAVPFDHGDCSVVVKALPLVPVALMLWKGDEEFPPEGNILFDQCISKFLSAEDIAWLAGMVVYPLMGMAKGKS